MTFEDSMHRVTLSGNEISSILYIMEGYINPSDDYSYDPDFRNDVDNIFAKLEEVADNWEGEFADPKVITTKDDYAECVDSLVDRMKSTKDNSQSDNSRE